MALDPKKMYLGNTARKSRTGATIAARRALEKHTLMRNAKLISLRLDEEKREEDEEKREKNEEKEG